MQMVNSKPVYIGVFYRQPKLGAEPLRNNMSLGPKLILPAAECIYSAEVASTLLNLIGDFSLHQLATEVNHVHQTDVHQVLNILQLLLVTNPDAFPPVIADPGLADHFILLAGPKLRPSIKKSSESTSSESLQVW